MHYVLGAGWPGPSACRPAPTRHIIASSALESFFGRMKQEIGRTDKLTFAQAEALIADYVDYYNNERCQRRLGGISPAAYAKKLEGLAA